ncbi:hypothetical protein M5K25_023802 [Dendrobium thyrsiflorum]|uniref:Uncharacterized protein n=1 Tax=Dendrobium thyrsiflorum TaxID=117978 RepID=A0ABD0U0F4_DENTH
MAEMEGELLDHQSISPSPLKRKSNLVPDEEEEAERTMKQQKSDAPLEECCDAGQDDKKVGANQNGNVDKVKGKAILSAADKGKGKMVVEEEGCDDQGGREFGDSSDDEDGSSEVDGNQIAP